MDIKVTCHAITNLIKYLAPKFTNSIWYSALATLDPHVNSKITQYERQESNFYSQSGFIFILQEFENDPQSRNLCEVLLRCSMVAFGEILLNIFFYRLCLFLISDF